MNKEIEIPEGHEARIESNKVIIEQKEGEDERIRKALLEYFNERNSYRDEDETFNGVPFSSIIAYLEKQKEPHYSPLCNTIKDKIREYIANHFIADTVVKTNMKSIVKAMEEGVRLGKEDQKSTENPRDIHNQGYVKGVEDAYNNVNEAKVILKRLAKENPKPTEWSEDDERILDNCIEYIKASCLNANDLYECIDWLKFLRSQSHWKPSKEQMEALRCAVNDSIMQYDYNASQLKEEVARTYSENLQSLLNDLNKL